MSIILMTPHEIMKLIAEKARSKRLEINLSQKTLSDKSGVSYGSLKKFEQTGIISFESLIKLAIVLECVDDFKILFSEKSHDSLLSLDQLIAEKKKKRGRK